LWQTVSGLLEFRRNRRFGKFRASV
jgi:hypothetical protein